VSQSRSSTGTENLIPRTLSICAEKQNEQVFQYAILERDEVLAGYVLEFAGIMTQRESLEELEENLREAYSLMVMEDHPEDYQTK
jgi:predicted RNase H-like HicB family nuclease